MDASVEHPAENPKTAIEDFNGSSLETSPVGIHSVTSSSSESSFQARDSNPVLLNSELRRIIGAFGAGYLLGKSGELDLSIIAGIFV